MALLRLLARLARYDRPAGRVLFLLSLLLMTLIIRRILSL